MQRDNGTVSVDRHSRHLVYNIVIVTQRFKQVCLRELKSVCLTDSPVPLLQLLPVEPCAKAFYIPHDTFSVAQLPAAKH